MISSGIKRQFGMVEEVKHVNLILIIYLRLQKVLKLYKIKKILVNAYCKTDLTVSDLCNKLLIS